MASKQVLDAVQILADEGVLPVARVTGLTMCIEGTTDDGVDAILTVVSPYDYITKTAGHVVYLDNLVRTTLQQGPYYGPISDK